MIVKTHPVLGISVREDGAVFAKNTGRSTGRHWTYGSDCHGYMGITIGGKHYSVHVLVAESFLGERPEGMEVDHINRNRKDNSVGNLRYATKSENRCNQDNVDRVLDAIGCHQREDRPAYNRYYASTENGKRARREANDRYWETHVSVRFSDGKTHAVEQMLAGKLLQLPVSQRIYRGEI